MENKTKSHTKNSRIKRENLQIIEDGKSGMEEKSDQIEPIQLIKKYDDEYSHELIVLGTFTSRLALGAFLVSLMERDTSQSYSDLDDLYLQKIKINPKYKSGQC